MDEYFSEQTETISRDLRSGVAARLQRIVASVSLWSAQRRQLRALIELDEQQLRDIGITRDQAIDEAGKPFWNAFSKR
jgi:uncharacterized protein YjiS (DUF1127 family)